MIQNLGSFEIHVLDKSFDRGSFDCGSQELNNFLKTKARQNQSIGFNKTFVTIANGDTSKRVLGFYCLSMAEIDLSSLPHEVTKKLPKHPVPVVRMGRLAVDSSIKGSGLGKLLLVDAMKRILRASEVIGVYALLVDAKNEKSKNFYLQFGFVPLRDDPMILFLPVASFPAER